LIGNPDNELLFSAASLWEVSIKRGLGRGDFKVDARLLRRGLLDNGYSELPILSDHVVATESLPPIHKDPFDRVLVAQATVEGVTLLMPNWPNPFLFFTSAIYAACQNIGEKPRSLKNVKRANQWPHATPFGVPRQGRQCNRE
jgi:hypothetical protein